MTPETRLAIVERLMALYNAQDADGYAEMMTEAGCEATYRGAVLREGREGVRAGLKAMFAEFPENRALVKASYVVGDKVVLHEEVFRSAASVPFEVISIYCFEGDLVERVEFVR
ncbi:nuclear transport factor 2 family protein [Polymorphobacter sp.]|uniref:nuclear transport factor 2 family protein n=1 Tax=Polymorphobacter sp. TaxID=1909290 RepID=UPI003F726D4F